MSITITSTITLNNGVEMPVFGLGVFKAGKGEPTTNAVQWALDAGYRHIDTARIYRNEDAVGEGIRRSAVHRDEIFLTTKLWNHDQGYDETLRAYDASLIALGVDVVDLYLMHWPVSEKRLDSWRAMERIYAEGRVRAIGVSNFTIRHLDELMQHASVTPAVNQVELHPFLTQPELVEHCGELGIAMTAYSPLTKGRMLDHPKLAELAVVVRRTPAQVLIRWSLQKGFVVIPKSSNEQRIIENAGVFDFELEDSVMSQLDDLDEGLRTAWDPTDVL